jgi:tyrosyl-tRNA synthetase
MNNLNIQNYKLYKDKNINNLSIENKIEDFFNRNIISNIINKDFFIKTINEGSCKFYIGIDPTKDKYHVGHLVPYISALRLLKLNANGVILVGGFTGQVGDPSFRNKERPVLGTEEVENNSNIFFDKLKYLFRDYLKDLIFVNNNDWLGSMTLSDFLNFSTYISANRLLKMDHIKTQLDKEVHLSFKEVCYTLLQAIDFKVLYDTHKVNLQIGGNDQWINILNGVNLISKMNSKESIGITMKLLLTSDGKKMSKTEGGAIWADGSMDPFEFWQYWRNVPDNQLKDLFYFFSFIPVEDINLMLENTSDENINNCKILLANEMSELVYGGDIINKINNILNEGGEAINIPINHVKNIIDILLKLKFIENKSIGKRNLESGAVKINNNKINENISIEDLIKNNSNEFIVQLGKGKKNKVIII